MKKDVKDFEKTQEQDLQQEQIQELEASENSEDIIPKRKKAKTSIIYIVGFILFIIAFSLMVAAMVICLVENKEDHDSFFATLFSGISAGLALLGIIFVCASKDKKPKKKKPKNKKNKKKRKHMREENTAEDAKDTPETETTETIKNNDEINSETKN